MIVDDEYYVRYGLKESIDWAKYDCEIICEATDAEDALEKFRFYMPEIVITDIRMEDTNGLDFIKNASAISKNTARFIILSGYSEFEYAKKAIEYGVSAYLTKPIKNADLIEIIEKIKKDIDVGKISASAMNTLEEELPKIKNVFLSNWLSGRLELSEINEKSLRYGIPIEYPYFCVAVTEVIGENISTILRQYITTMLSSYSDIDILTADNINNYAFILFQKESNHDEINTVFKNIKLYLSEITEKDVALGISNVCCDISEMHLAYSNAKKALGSNIERDGIYFYKENTYRYETLQALSIIENEFNLPITASYVAAKINISTSHFMFLFKADTDKTFNEYLTEYRMEKAIEYIKSHKYKMYEISNNVGYKNPKYFRKQFKQYTGKNPTDYFKD